MKKYLAVALVLASTQAQAIVFDAYKDLLEKDLTCASYPHTDIKMHLQLLKETGAIPNNSVIPKAGRKATAFKAAEGLSVFGFPLVSVMLYPANGQIAPMIAVTLAAKPKAVASAIAARAKAQGAKLHEIQGSYSGDNEDKGFTLAVMPDKGGTTLSCSTFEP